MSFVTVKFGNNQNVLFNPNCKTAVLLDDIKRRCKCRDASILDVSDEKGEVKHLQDHADEYATKILKGRETLILLEVKTNDETNEVTYLPLLKNMKKLYPTVTERLTSSANKTEDNANDANQKSLAKLQKNKHGSQLTSNSLQVQQKGKKNNAEYQKRRANSDRSQHKSTRR